jgi:hypothetical protein
MPGTSDFGTFGRYTELSLDEMTADQKRVYEFTVKRRGEVPGPYKIWLQNPKLIEVWSLSELITKVTHRCPKRRSRSPRT